MHIELGSIGSGVASVASAVSRVPASLGRLSDFGPILEGPLTPIINEGPVGLADFKNTVTEINFLPQPELNPANVVAEAESILAQAKILQPEVIPVPVREAFVPQVEPMIAPLTIPKIVEFPKPQIVISPALESVTGVQVKTNNLTSVRPAAVLAVLPQPALEEEVEEEVITKKEVAEQTIAEEKEEIEKTELKDVVDESVLNTRIEEFSNAAEIVGAEMEEIDGKRVVELVGTETAEKRSGLVKQRGPDGSREETIGAVASKKFKSVKEAKEKIVVIITQKVRVKRARGGIAVGHEAVARVLKYFFVKARPAEQTITRVTKKQQAQVVPVAAPKVIGPRIEDLGLAEVFPKAA